MLSGFQQFPNLSQLGGIGTQVPPQFASQVGAGFQNSLGNQAGMAIQQGLGLQGLQQGGQPGFQQGIMQGLGLQQPGIQQPGMQQGLQQGLQPGLQQGLQPGFQQGAFNQPNQFAQQPLGGYGMPQQQAGLIGGAGYAGQQGLGYPGQQQGFGYPGQQQGMLGQLPPQYAQGQYPIGQGGQAYPNQLLQSQYLPGQFPQGQGMQSQYLSPQSPQQYGQSFGPGVRGSQYGGQPVTTTVHEVFDETIIIPQGGSVPLASSQYYDQPLRSSRISYQMPAVSYAQPLRASRVSYGAPVTTAITAPRVTRVSYGAPVTTSVRTSVLPERHYLGSYYVAQPMSSYSSCPIASSPYSSYYPSSGQYQSLGSSGQYQSLGACGSCSPRDSYRNYW